MNLDLFENEKTGQLQDFPDYIITSFGRIWSNHHNKWLKTWSRPNGKYIQVTLCNNGNKQYFYLHRLVAELFLPNPNNLPVVNHKDENPLNNQVENLEWATQKENCNYKNHNAKVSEARKKYLQENPIPSLGESPYAKKIYMCDKKTHKIIQEFGSITEACLYLNKNKQASGNIVKVLKNEGRQSAYGYFWKYVDNKT